MIFAPALLAKITARQKTQTRRPVKDPVLKRRRNGTTYWTKPFIPAVGRSLPVQPDRGKHAICHVQITDVRREPVGDITTQDARAEGFKSRDAFAAYWVRLYDKAWLKRERFDVADGCGPEEAGIVERLLVERFDAHHADTLVWVISFELVEEPDIYLAEATRGGADYGDNEADYVASPAKAIDPLPVPPAAFVDRLAKAAEPRNAALRATFESDLEAERARRKAASPRTLQRIQRGRSLRDAA